MAARAFDIEGTIAHMAATGADTRKILEAITQAEKSHQVSFNTLNISVASLQEKVLSIGTQVSNLTIEVQTIRDGKASRPELAASEARYDSRLSDIKTEFAKELSRMEHDVDKDVEGFQSMYESLVGEMKDMREQSSRECGSLGVKLDSLITSRDSLDNKVKGIDDRLAKIEPLRDTWLQMMGARWIIGTISAGLGGGFVWLLQHLFGK